MAEPLVHLRHVRAIRRPGARILCIPGIRQWCERYGIDFEDFAVNGVAGERIVEIGDSFGMKALDNAREEAARGLE